MANNRVYLECPVDEARIFLGKYYPSHWEWGSWTEDFGDQLADFMREHNHAHSDDALLGTRGGQFPFRFALESGPEVEAKREILQKVSTK